MKITDVSARAVDFGQGFSWGGRMSMEVIGVFVEINTDDGLTGYGASWTAQLPAATIVAAIEHGVAPGLIGLSPFDRPAAFAPAWRGFRVGLPLPAIGVVDVALWDLAGKAAGVSVAELLGRRREALKGCASAPPCADVDDCVLMARELVSSGFRAVKLHSCGDARVDIDACHAVREAVGDGVELMMDAMAILHRDEAKMLGRALDELGFRWYEDPLVDDDLDGWRELRGALDTPLAGVDGLRYTVRDYARPVAEGSFDVVRMDAARHGISQLNALAALADGFAIGCEGHAFGPALAQAANLQTALAAPGARYCELPVPVGGLDHGVKRGLTLDGDGFVHPLPGPGLGMEVDLDAM